MTLSLWLRQDKKIMSAQATQVHPFEDGNTIISDQDSYCSTEQQKINYLELIGGNLRPILLSFKFMGLYYGPTKSDEILLGNSSHHQVGRYWYEKLYCFLVLTLMLWSSIVMVLVSIGHHGLGLGTRIFVAFVYCCWHFHTNCNAAACLAMLPCGRKKRSRFENFLLKPINFPEGQHLQQFSARKTLILSWVLIIGNSCLNALLSFVSSIALPQFPPWNRWPTASAIGYSVICFYNNAAWVLPLALYSIICRHLLILITNLETSIKSKVEKRTLTFKFIRKKHMELCEFIETADNVLNYLALSCYAGYIPLLCLLFNQLAKFSSVKDIQVFLLICYMFWSIVSFGIMSFVSYVAAGVSSKVN